MATQPAHPAASAAQPPLLARFAARFRTVRSRAVLQELRLHAPDELARMITDLDRELDATFVAEVERLLDAHGYSRLLHAQTLMPVMLERFGVAAEPAADMSQLQKVCGACVVAGRCWRALRGGEPAASCRAFCPNAAAFDRLAAEPR